MEMAEKNNQYRQISIEIDTDFQLKELSTKVSNSLNNKESDIIKQF